jgi:streptogramin lyase
MESDMMQSRSFFKPQTQRTPQILSSAFALSLAALLSGCANNVGAGVETASSQSGAAVHVFGQVHGGQQPVAGATIQLYTVGTAGLKSASHALISATLTTSDGTGSGDSNANPGNANNTLPVGNFTLPAGSYSCTGATPGTEVYLVASGGNPGSGTNPNLTLVAALGSCATLLANASTTFVNINEITTVAAAYALAPFATDLTHIGATSTPSGLLNAFANAAALANTASGTAGGVSLPSGAVVPVATLNTLADIIATCVNSTGASSPTCTTLFGATTAADTFGAALAIAKNPGASSITGLYSLASSSPPFQPTLSTTPNDFTVALTYTAGGALAAPYSVAIDANGDAWIANEAGTAVTELSPTGAVLATPTATGLIGPRGIAIDRTGNVWVANTGGNSVVEFSLTGGAVTATNSYTSGGINTPTAIALDSHGNAFIANLNGSSVTELNSSGIAQNGSPLTGSGNIVSPSGIALDPSGNVYVTSAQGNAVKLSNTGVFTSLYNDSALQGPMSLAVDPSSRVFLAGSTSGAAIAGAVSEFTSAGVSALSTPVSLAASNLGGTASDGTSVWVANSATSGSLAQLAYGSATASSPSAGFGTLNTPAGVAVDGSGSVWTANSGSNSVTKFIGLAVPVTTPISASVGP